ncbi:MAG TPA: SemiSWEET transporter [Chitinophagaceae bacterium]|nr:SemiSWEET transporter [Chitinophagaceae bacterium]
MTGVQLLGTAAAAITTLTFLPQVIKTWRDKSAKEISLLMFIIAVVNEILWIIYGILRDDMIIIATNVIMVIMALTMIYLKFRYSK